MFGYLVAAAAGFGIAKLMDSTTLADASGASSEGVGSGEGWYYLGYEIGYSGAGKKHLKEVDGPFTTEGKARSKIQYADDPDPRSGWKNEVKYLKKAPRGFES